MQQTGYRSPRDRFLARANASFSGRQIVYTKPFQVCCTRPGICHSLGTDQRRRLHPSPRVGKRLYWSPRRLSTAGVLFPRARVKNILDGGNRELRGARRLRHRVVRSKAEGPINICSRQGRYKLFVSAPVFRTIYSGRVNPELATEM